MKKFKNCKLSIIIILIATLCVSAAIAIFGLSANKGTGAGNSSAEITAPEKSASSAIANGEETASGNISAPKLDAKATGVTVNSGTTASAMATAWNNAVTQSSSSNEVTFVLQANWTAPASGSSTSFGTGTGFSSGALCVPAGKKIVLDLAGHTLNRGLSSKSAVAGGGVISVYDSTLTITDSVGGGKITGGNTTGDGGGITISTSNYSVGSNVYLNGGAITDNKAKDGGGVYSGGYTNFCMYGGEISYNTATSKGGGIRWGDPTGAEVNGGKITHNTAGAQGGGIYSSYFINSGINNAEISYNTSSGLGSGVYSEYPATYNNAKIINNTGGVGIYGGNNGPITLTNTEVINNTGTSSDTVAGVYSSAASSTDTVVIRIAGYTKIYDNKKSGAQSNLYLPTGKTIGVVGALAIESNKARIGVTHQTDVCTLTSGFGLSGNSNATTYFFSDKGKTISTSNGEVCTTATAVTLASLTWQYRIGSDGAWSTVTGGNFSKEYSGKQFYVRALNSANSTVTTYGGTSIKTPGDYLVYVSTGAAQYINSSFTFTVTKKTLDVVWSGATLTYNGTMQYPTPGLSGLVSGDDVKLNVDTTSAGINAGSGYKVTVTGASGADMGNYKLGSETYSKTYSIEKASITSATVTFAVTNYTYNGSAQTPTPTVKLGTKTLTPGTDYTVAYTNNTNAGTATATITGAGNYKDTATAKGSFTIDPKTITGSFLTLSGTSATYTGSAITSITATVKDGTTTLNTTSHYSVAYTNNTNVGSATITVTGKGNYTGTASKDFTITAKALTNSNATVTLGTTTYTYDGSAKTPSVSSVVTGSLTVPSSSYAIAYSNNVNASTSATVTLTLSGNYSGTLTKTFTINKAAIGTATVAFAVTHYTYTGSAISPAATVTLSSKTLAPTTDYTIAYTGNTNAGTATATVTGTGNYSGTATGSFTIDPKTITGSFLTLSGTTATYTGSAITSITATVKDGTTTLNTTNHYTVAYTNNTNVGSATITVTGKGNYTGSVSKDFTITPLALTSANATVNLGTTSYTYDGSLKTPTVSSVVTGSLTVPSSSYAIAYSNNLNASTSATVTITLSGNYSGTLTKTFTIDKAPITNATVSFGVTNYTYTGAAISPVAMVTISSKNLAQGTDYMIAYTNNTNAGTATVTVTGTGNYSGTKTGSFTIDKRQIFVTGISVADKAYDGTKTATVDMSKVKILGIVDADKTKLGLAFTAGTEFDGASVGFHSVAITGVTLTGDAAGNYVLNSDELTGYATIHPATITISGVVANDKTYDGTTSATFNKDGATITGAVSGEVSSLLQNLIINGYFDSKNAGDGVAVSVSGYVLGGDYAGNYVVDLENSATSLTANIAKAQVEVTLGKAEYTITYGNALKITYTQNSPVKSEGIGLTLEFYDEHGNTKLDGVPTDAGKYLVKVAVDADDVNVGNYTIKTTGEGIISQATVTIEKATLTVTVEDLEIEYGDEKPADDDYTLIFNGWLNGDKAAFEDGDITFIKDIVISTDYAKGDDADAYDITLSEGELKNYELTFVDGVLWVMPKKVTVIIDDKSVVYGEDEAELTSNGTEDMQITLEREEGANVGKYVISGDWDNDNYDVTFINGLYEITKAKLTVTAKPKSITYGDVAANDGVTYTGFADGEDENVLGGELGYRYTYTQYGNIYEDGTNNAIAYYIIPYGYTSSNYEIEYVNGLLTVNKKAATVTLTNAASDITSVPADREVAAQKMKYAVNGTVNGDDLIIILSIAENGENGAYTVPWCAVGVYKVTGTAGNSNYNVTFVYEGGLTYGTYTVTQGTLIVTANTLIIGYGDVVAFPADLDEAVTAEGLPAGSTLKELVQSGVISGTLTIVPYGDEKYDEYATMGSAYQLGGDIFDASGNRISYIIIPTGLSSASYNIIFKPGKLMIEPKSIVVTLDNKSSVYGEALKELTASAEGLVNYDPEEKSVVEFLGITGLVKADGSDAGSYAITATGSDNKNYRVTFAYGVYTIEQYEVTLDWEIEEKYTYNGTEQAPVAKFEMPDGTVYKSTDTTDKYIEVNGGGTNAGDYKAQALLLNSNLKFKADTETEQSFTIEKKQLIVTWYADKDDIGNEDKAVAPNSSPIEYEYKTRHPYAPVVKLEGIEEVDESEDFYYISGEQTAVSLSPYEAVLHILNANYCVAQDDMKIFFVIVKSAPDEFAWYEDADFATQISSLKKYTYNGGVQHPVAKALGDEEFVYVIYLITGDTEKKVISTIDVGSYKIVATPVNSNLQLTETQATFYFDIVAMEVSVNWSAKTFEYNGLEQVPTAYYIDALGQKVNLTVNGDKGVDANGEDESYSISVTLENGNYVFIVDGEATDTIETTYTITAKNITVKWESKIDEAGNWTMVYNGTVVNSDEEHKDLTATATMINAVENVGLKMTVMYQANENDTPVEVSEIHDAGIYTLCVGLAENSPNYNVVDAEKIFTIQKKQLTVSAVNKEVNTGAVAPALTATYEGFVENESAASLGLDESKWLTTNYNLNSPYIDENEYTKDGDIEKLVTLADVTAGGYKGYFIVLTDSEARLEELNGLLHNYDWSFNYGRMIIIAVNGDVSIILTQSYNGEDQLPAAKYKSGNNWIDLKVEVYTDGTYTEKVENPEVKNVGEYYVLLKKYSEDNVTLEGAEADGSVKKVFNIIAREIEVKIIDKSVVYGELTEDNVEELLASAWEYASKDALRRPLEQDEDAIGINLIAEFDFVGGYATVNAYTLTGEWSEDETLRKNYNVVFVGSNGDKGELKVTEAEITFTATLTEGVNQILETDKANGNYLIGLYSRKDGKYEHIDIAGNQEAAVKIYYSNIYDRSVYELTDNLPQDEDDAAWREMPLCSMPVAADGSYYVNFKVEVANHKTYYGQWTVEVIAGKAYVRIIFSDKQFTTTYGDEVLNGTDLAAKLYNEGYVSCLDLTEDTFRENVENGNLTAKLLADGDITVGSYAIVFEGIEKINPDWIITYKHDVNANDDTATNIGRYVVTQRNITLSWDKTSFVYDGEAHMPTPTIAGWKLLTSVQNGTVTVYTFENEISGVTLNLTVKTNGGDFTSVGSENIVIAEIEDVNYALDSLNATRAVSIIGESTPAPVDPVDPINYIVQNGIPEWVAWLIGAVAAIALVAIIVLAVKSSKVKSLADDDGFYDDIDENS